MKRLFYLIVAIVAASCAKENRFHVNGTISGAADTTLYLEHISLGDGIVAVDSVRLNGEGTFQLRNPAITRSRMYYEAIAEILPDVKLYINTGDGTSINALLPLESLAGGN